MSVADVHVQLNKLGHDVGYSTVAGWFNGNRGVRSMEHLKALCVVLQTDLNSLTGDEVEIAEDPIDASVVREMRDLTAVQREAVLALVRSMKPRP